MKTSFIGASGGVSRLTRPCLAIVAAAWVFKGFCPSALAGASSLGEALGREDAAHDQYYTELVKLGPDATEAQRKDLRARTILPAVAAVSGASASAAARQEQSVRQALYEAVVQRLGLQLAPRWLTQWLSPKGERPSAAPAPAVPPVGTPARREAPNGAALDGSNVPAEIDFTKP